jgi:hypothetical protein
MIEYKLLNKDHSPITLDDVNEIGETIGSIFPEQEQEKVGGKIRKTYCVNEQTFHIYYGYSCTDISLPIKYGKKIKKTLKELAQLKFERIQCQ